MGIKYGYYLDGWGLREMGQAYSASTALNSLGAATNRFRMSLVSLRSVKMSPTLYPKLILPIENIQFLSESCGSHGCIDQTAPASLLFSIGH